MGSYSDTSPYDCPKSRPILEDACRYLAQCPVREDIVGELSLQAMLASGKPEFLDRIRTLARRIGPADLKLELKSGMYAWEWGYANLFLTSVYRKLNDEDLEQLWPDIVRAAEKPAPSGEMFADEIHVASLELLAKHHIAEGMRLCLIYARTQNPWASENRMWEIMKSLKTYGAAAKPLLPELRDLATACRNEKDFPNNCKKKKTAAVEDAIKASDGPGLLADLRRRTLPWRSAPASASPNTPETR